jgi:DNA-binding MarR family transcriptional regulator
MAMWLRFMQYIPTEGITVADLQSRLAISNKGLQTWLTRLGKWWRYLTIVDPGPAASAKRIGSQALVGLTAGGRKAIEVWRTLMPIVEARWRERFGGPTVGALEEALRKVARRLDPAAPAHFAVLEYDDQKSRAARVRLAARELALPELLAKILVALASEFDAESVAPLAVCANVLRVTPDAGIRVRDFARLTGLAPVGVADAVRPLARAHLGAVRSDPSGGRSRILTITPQARLARDSYVSLLSRIENDWKNRFGEDTVHRLRTTLDAIVRGRDGAPSPLLRGLTPYPDGWRAHLPPLEGLPHFPMESHRGGFPDGS